jgi:hypothetical protein
MMLQPFLLLGSHSFSVKKAQVSERGHLLDAVVLISWMTDKDCADSSSATHPLPRSGSLYPRNPSMTTCQCGTNRNFRAMPAQSLEFWERDVEMTSGAKLVLPRFNRT